MNPWQRGKKAPERSPLAKAVGRRPLARPRRSGSSQLVVVVENNKRGRREPPAFFFGTAAARPTRSSERLRLPAALSPPSHARAPVPTCTPKMQVSARLVCRSRSRCLPARHSSYHRLYARHSLRPSITPRCLTPRHVRSDGPQSSVCATFATQRQHLVRQLLAEKKALQQEGPTTRNDTPVGSGVVSKRYATSFRARNVSPLYPIPRSPRSTVMCHPR